MILQCQKISEKEDPETSCFTTNWLSWLISIQDRSFVILKEWEPWYFDLLIWFDFDLQNEDSQERSGCQLERSESLNKAEEFSAHSRSTREVMIHPEPKSFTTAQEGEIS